MASFAVPIRLSPRSDDCAPFPRSLLGTNDFFDHLVLGFGDIGDATAPTAAIVAHGLFRVPDNYVGSPGFLIEWTTTKNTGNVVWDVDLRAVGGDDLESMDQATAQESLSVTDAAGSAAHEKMQATVSATAGNFAAGDLVEVILRRDGTDASDTLAGCAMLEELFFTYADA